MMAEHASMEVQDKRPVSTGAAIPDVETRTPDVERGCIVEYKGRKRGRGIRSTDTGNNAKRAKRKESNAMTLSHSPFMDLPFEVYEEIFKYSKPVDLLNLSRTSVSWHMFFRDTESSRIWRAARRNIPNMPDRHESMTEMRYAHLAFGYICDFCHRDTRKLKISCQVYWKLRVRSCKACLGNRDFFVQGLPMERVYELERFSRVNYTLHSLALIKRWWDEYNRIDFNQRKDWVKQKIAKEESIVLHATECETWAFQYERLLAQEIKEEGEALVIKRAKALGWGDEIARMAGQERSLLMDGRIAKACKKVMNEKVLADLEIVINLIMQHKKSERIQRLRNHLIRDFLKALDEIRNVGTNQLPFNSVFPTTADLFMLPRVQEVLNSCNPEDLTFDPTCLEEIQDSFFQLTVEWYKKTLRELLHLVIPNGAPDSYDEEMMLRLATTLFKCTKCSQGASMRYITAIMHSCARQLPSPVPFMTMPQPLLGPVGSVLNEASQWLMFNPEYGVPWNALGVIEVCSTGYEIGSLVVTMCGLDTVWTTAKDMDALNPIFECVPCGNEYSGRCMMTWDRAVEHKKCHHTSEVTSSIKLPRLQPEEEAKIRGNIAERLARKQSNRDYKELYCAHCALAGNLVDLKRHVLWSHHLLDGQECEKDVLECIISSIDACVVQEEYWAWPYA